MATNNTQNSREDAELVMETVSMVTRTIRAEMRKNRPDEMSMQQFRALGVVQRHSGASLTVLAGHLGLTLASASKLVAGLVSQGLLTRTDLPEDRRKLELCVTEAGSHALELGRASALGRLAEVLAALDDPDLVAVKQAMGVLHRALAEEDS